MAVIFWYVGQGPAYRKYQPTDYFSSLRTIRGGISTGQVLQLWVTRRPSDSICIQHAESVSERGRV
ncbi:hypothetical protein ASPFODRAFT_55040, partial [Aspergillus luchuensis CBS 106.47]